MKKNMRSVEGRKGGERREGSKGERREGRKEGRKMKEGNPCLWASMHYTYIYIYIYNYTCRHYT
jgi:hypothetical protein